MKKLVSVLLTVAMLFSISTAVLAADIPQQDYPQRFWDVPKDHWAFNYIAELVNKGVLAGYEDGSFKPDSTVTRAEWAKIMVLAAGLPVNDNNVYFTDMGNHWANAYVNTAKDYLAAYTDGTFKPDQAAVREDVTVSMVKLKGYDVSNVDYSYLSQFTDVNSISNSLKAYVAVAVEKDLISGFDDGTFRGQNTLTRAEAATLLWRAFQYGNDNKVVDTPDTLSTAPVVPTWTQKPAETETPKPTAMPVETPKSTKMPEIEKPYIIDTLKQVELEQDFTYDGDLIYYIESTDIYSLDPYSGNTDIIYSTDDLILQKNEMQEREVAKVETVQTEESDAEASETAETMEIKTEEGIIEEYSNYIPTQIKYDAYNDRLIMMGYYKNAKIAFESQNDNASYYVAYDINADELFWELGEPYDPSTPIEFCCFLSKNKAVLYNYYHYDSHNYDHHDYDYYIVNTDTKSEIDWIGDQTIYWPSKNELYGVNSINGYTFTDSGDYCNIYLNKYDFSACSFNELFIFPLDSCVGINDENVYYWNGKAISKLNLNSGKTSELAINSSSEYCDVLDMTAVSISNIWTEFIPVSDTHFVFYDSAAKAFRTLSKR